MISFRCWYCGRNYLVQTERAGEKRVCGCGRRIRMPRRSGGSCRDRTLVDWIVEFTVYGGGGAVLGGMLALLLVTRVPFLSRAIGTVRPIVVGALVGLLAGRWAARRASTGSAV